MRDASLSIKSSKKTLTATINFSPPFISQVLRTKMRIRPLLFHRQQKVPHSDKFGCLINPLMRLLYHFPIVTLHCVPSTHKIFFATNQTCIWLLTGAISYCQSDGCLVVAAVILCTSLLFDFTRR